jgi:hypothetical protein
MRCGQAHLKKSDVEAKVNYIAVFDVVVLALEPHFARFLGALLPVTGNEVVIADYFSANESVLEIGVYYPGGLWSRRTYRYGPRSGFFRTRGKVGLQPEQTERSAD